MMSRELSVSVFILVVVVVVCYFLPVGEEMMEDRSCLADSDCKLVYDNCGCEALNVNSYIHEDDRETEIMCFWNSCRGQDAVAVCTMGTCAINYTRKFNAP